MDWEAYLHLLQTVVLQEVRATVTKRRFWLQQDGATAHPAVRERKWRGGKFGDRVISRFSGHPAILHPVPGVPEL